MDIRLSSTTGSGFRKRPRRRGKPVALAALVRSVETPWKHWTSGTRGDHGSRGGVSDVNVGATANGMARVVGLNNQIRKDVLCGPSLFQIVRPVSLACR
jgi:hypothetical protein